MQRNNTKILDEIICAERMYHEISGLIQPKTYKEGFELYDYIRGRKIKDLCRSYQRIHQEGRMQGIL
jgi:hypothetical protein